MVRPACTRESIRIVLDVGHKPQAGGALSARGVYEYQFNLALADAINNHLLSAGVRRPHVDGRRPA
jgi:N-acetylmuramoyl-L-alanine amidase